ncbi:hypothetical protein [Vulcanococcus sp.]|jgi:hypothetical protein|uniref:hypothetical protein n=1 Tax=Vulcanococcus sp. TaxID=2856995 RepID=UPI0037DA4D83
MTYWYSPFPLPAATVDLLTTTGLEPWPSTKPPAPNADGLLIYDSPDQLVAAAVQPTLQQLVEGYRQLLDWSERTAQPLLAHWQLQQLGPRGLRDWIASHANTGGPFQAPVAQPIPIPSLVGAALLSLIEVEPQLLEAYLDLELRAELLGREPDLHYRQRLRQGSTQGDLLLQELRHALGAPTELERQESELRTAQEEAELTLLQLHQVQEELEAIVLADRERQQLLEASSQELEKLKPRVAELEQQLERQDDALKTAQEEAELTLLQLHQVQEELEHYFLLSRSQHSLLNQHGQQQREVQKLLAVLVKQQLSPGAAPRP